MLPDPLGEHLLVPLRNFEFGLQVFFSNNEKPGSETDISGRRHNTSPALKSCRKSVLSYPMYVALGKHVFCKGWGLGKKILNLK